MPIETRGVAASIERVGAVEIGRGEAHQPRAQQLRDFLGGSATSHEQLLAREGVLLHHARYMMQAGMRKRDDIYPSPGLSAVASRFFEHGAVLADQIDETADEAVERA